MPLANATTTLTDNTADSGLGTAFTSLNATAGATYDQSGSFVSGWMPTDYLLFGGSAFALGIGGLRGVDNSVPPSMSGQWGEIVEFSPGSGGLQIQGAVVAGGPASTTYNTVIFGDNPTNTYHYFTGYNFNSTGNGSSLNQAVFCVDWDFANNTSDKFPCGFGAWGAEDGMHYIGGFSTAGLFFGVNMGVAPTDSMEEIAGTVWPARAVVSIRAAASQSAPLLKFKASDDSDLVGIQVEKSGQATVTPVATSALPTCAMTTGPGTRAAVNDATLPAIGVVLTGGGAVFATVHCSLATGTYFVDGL